MSAGYHIKVRVGVVLLKAGQLLLARQNGHPFWVLPGGTLEIGEGLQEAAMREMKEESGLDIAIDRLLYIGDFIQQSFAESNQGPSPAQKQTMDVVFQGRFLGGSLQMALDENLDELAFFDYSTLETMRLEPELIMERLKTDWQAGKLSEMGQLVNGNQTVYLGKYQ